MGPFPSMSICPTAIKYEVQHWKGIFVSKRVPEPLRDPNVRIKKKYNNRKPWLSEGLKNSISDKNKLYVK